MNFNFESPAKIIFGSGKIQELPELIKKISDDVLLISGRSDRYAPIVSSLTDLGINVSQYKVTNEPLIEDVDSGVKIAKLNRSSLILGIGGGSVIDVAKAVSIMLLNQGEVLDYLEVIGGGQALTEPSIPCFVVPTTSGTGSEVTKNSVLKSLIHKRKVSIRSPFMIPDLVLIDPDLMKTLPLNITLYTGMDALTQVIEPYLSNSSNYFTDMLCIDAIKKGIPALKDLNQNLISDKSRTDMAFVSLMGGLALANAKLGVVHGFAGPIGGMFDIPHGLVCAVLLPISLKFNLEAVRNRGNRDQLEKFSSLGKLLTGSEKASPEDGVALLYSLNKELNIPKFSSLGIKESDLHEIVIQSKDSSSMKGNIIPLTEDELTAILLESL